MKQNNKRIKIIDNIGQFLYQLHYCKRGRFAKTILIIANKMLLYHVMVPIGTSTWVYIHSCIIPYLNAQHMGKGTIIGEYKYTPICVPLSMGKGTDTGVLYMWRTVLSHYIYSYNSLLCHISTMAKGSETEVYVNPCNVPLLPYLKHWNWDLCRITYIFNRVDLYIFFSGLTRNNAHLSKTLFLIA